MSRIWPNSLSIGTNKSVRRAFRKDSLSQGWYNVRMKSKTKIGAEVTRRPRGRPREFDVDQVLDAAMQVFWQKGYEATSLSDLTRATGLKSPSLYAAFGDKEALFRKVLDRYFQGPAAYLQAAMDAPTAYATVERLLFGAIDLLTAPGNPSVCLIAQGTLFCGEEADPIRREVTVRRQRGEARLRARLERGVSAGELPLDTDVAGLTLYYATVMRGLGISALTGASREELIGVARMALNTWPKMTCQLQPL
jgi:AcrR family transcriptional regulator